MEPIRISNQEAELLPDPGTKYRRLTRVIRRIFPRRGVDVGEVQNEEPEDITRSRRFVIGVSPYTNKRIVLRRREKAE